MLTNHETLPRALRWSKPSEGRRAPATLLGLLLLVTAVLLPAQGPPEDLSRAWLLQTGPRPGRVIPFMDAAVPHQFLVYRRTGEEQVLHEVELVYTRDPLAFPEDWVTFVCSNLSLSTTREGGRLLAGFTLGADRSFVLAFSTLSPDGRRMAPQEPDCAFLSTMLEEFRFFGGLTLREPVPAPFPAAF